MPSFSYVLGVILVCCVIGCESSVTAPVIDVAPPPRTIPPQEKVRDSIHVLEIGVRRFAWQRPLSKDTYMSSDGVLSVKHWGPDLLFNQKMERVVQDSILSMIGDLDQLSNFKVSCRQDRYYMIYRTIYATGEKRQGVFQPCMVDDSTRSILEGLKLLEAQSQRVAMEQAPWNGVRQEAELLTHEVHSPDSLRFVVRLINETEKPRDMVFTRTSMIKLFSTSGHGRTEWGFAHCWWFRQTCENRTVPIGPGETVELIETIPLSAFSVPASISKRTLQVQYVPAGIGYDGPILSGSARMYQ